MNVNSYQIRYTQKSVRPETENNGSWIITDPRVVYASLSNVYAVFLLKKILNLADDFNRVDMVSYKYFKQNLRFRIRKNLGKGSKKRG